MNKAVTLILALVLLSGMSWASNMTTAVAPASGVRAEAPPFQSPPMPVGNQDATLLTQDFSGSWTTTSPPAGWTITFTGAGPDANDWYNAGGYAALYWYPYDYGQTDILMSPVINCGLYTNVVFSCYTYYSWYSSYTAQIQGSEDGGATWTHVLWSATSSGYNGTMTFPLAWAAGKQLRLRWYGYGDIYNINNWYADNALVTGDIMVANDISVEQILAPIDPFYAFGDSIQPKATVKNNGTATQTNVPIRCRMRDNAGGAIAYDSVLTITLTPGQVATVTFPIWVPLAQEKTYTDTIRSESPGDQNPVNDAKSNTVAVTEWGSQCYRYTDLTWENGTRYVTSPYDGEYLTQFNVVGSPGTLTGANYWITDNSGIYSYTKRLRVYAMDGAGGQPGTVLWDSLKTINSALWPSFINNQFTFNPPISIPSNVSVIGVSYGWNGSYYSFVGDDETPPIQTGNDWGRATSTAPWEHNLSYENDAAQDFGIEACFRARLLDGTITDITAPPAVVDSNTAFDPQIVVKNVGLKARTNIPVKFNLVRTGAPYDTIYAGTANSGPVGIGGSKTVTFTGANVKPDPDYFTMKGISCMPFDNKNDNDTLAMPLFVRYLDVKTTIVSPRKAEVPGNVPVMIKLTNNGNVDALVPRLDVTINPAGYGDYKENIAIPAGTSQTVVLATWVATGGLKETCTAWITYPADMNHGTLNDGIWNDTAQTVTATGVPGWNEMTSLPAPPSGKTIKDGGCMAYDAGTDLIYASKGNKTGDFYAYDVNAGTWATLTTIPLGAEGKQVYKGSVICSDGEGNLYLTKGNNTIGFWGYNAGTKAWTQLTNAPLGSSGKKVKQGCGIAWSTKNGIGAAYLLKGYRNEFHKYDPGTNSWTQLLDAPIGTANHIKWDAGSWLVADPDGGHMLYAFKAKYHEFYTYDTDADTWSHAKNPMPIPGSNGNRKAKDGSCAAWYSGKIYAFKGGNTNEFWRYFPLGDSWKKQDDIPLVGLAGQRKKVKAGAALAGYPGTGVYAFKGNKSLEFWRYTPYDVIGAQPSRDGVTAGSAGIGSVSFAIAPNPLSGGFATVRYSLPKAGLATLNVFDVTGRTVLSQTMAAGRTGTASLDLRKLEAGVYLVKVATEGFSTTQKLVVEH